jgi:hypothetical protein
MDEKDGPKSGTAVGTSDPEASLFRSSDIILLRSRNDKSMNWKALLLRLLELNQMEAWFAPSRFSTYEKNKQLEKQFFARIGAGGWWGFGTGLGHTEGKKLEGIGSSG